MQLVLLLLQFLAGLIIFPCGSLWAGAITHIVGEPLQDVRAVYSSCILLILLTTYTLATTASLLLHNRLVVPRLRQLEEVEIEWRTHDMMFFTVSTQLQPVMVLQSSGQLGKAAPTSQQPAATESVQPHKPDLLIHCLPLSGRACLGQPLMTSDLQLVGRIECVY